MKSIVRFLGPIIGTFVCVFSLTSCVISGGGPQLGSPEPSTTAELYEQAMANREQFWKELDDMEKVVGGQWENADTRIAENCLGRMSNRAYSYSGLRKRVGPVDDAHETADAIEKYWKDQGYATQQTSYAKDHLMVVAKDLNGWELGLTTQGVGPSRRTTLDAQTGCFRGDYGAVLDYQIKWEKEHPQPTPPEPDMQDAPAQ